MMIRKILLTLLVTASALLSVYAQEDLCPPYDEIDPLIDCLKVNSYGELSEIIQNAVSGDEITLCPFFLRKVSSIPPIRVKTGVRILCARTSSDEFCTITGFGTHLIIDTAEDTLLQGFSFRESNDHAVLVAGEQKNSELATHTFCQLSFLENVRTKNTRGGAMMLEKSAGIINIFECFFQENFSSTYGAAIYSRADQLNVMFSMFVKNRSTGYGPALYTAAGGNLMIKSTSFLGNKGREGHDIVFNPGNGTKTYEDGFENRINDGDCRGVFHLVSQSCIVFEKSPAPTNRPSKAPTPTKAPTFNPTAIPTQKTTLTPTQKPTIKITTPPSLSPTFFPTTSSPTVDPTNVPTSTPTTTATTQVPTREPSKRLTAAPTFAPTMKPSEATVATPTRTPTTKPTTKPSPEDTISNKCLFRTISAESNCVDVHSFDEFKDVIESGSNDVIFCGGFNFFKREQGAVDVTSDIDIRCIEQCSFSGFGPFMSVSGISKIRLQNLKFINSQDSSAVVISTITGAAQTTFCNTEFARNQISFEKNDLGGALTIERKSGVVNIVNSTFTGNTAAHGGAIHSDGFKLNIVGSRFVANNAYKTGNAIFVGEGNHLSIYSSTFILNTEAPTRYSGRGDSTGSMAIVVQPGTSIRNGSTRGNVIIGEGNQMALSGSCKGVYSESEDNCDPFE